MRTSTHTHNSPILRSRIAWAGLLAFSICLLLGLSWTQAQAAEPAQPAPGKFDELPCDEKRKNDRTIMGKLLKDQNISAADTTRLLSYAEEYALARWTVKAHEHEIPLFRRDLLNSFRQAGKSPQTYNQLNDLVLRVMGGVAKGNYSPVARFNATLAIGDLNARHPSRSSEAPVPLPQALTLLLEVYNDANMMDGVRFGALLGISRHAALGIANEQVRNAQVLPAMVALAKANQPPVGRSTEGHSWMRVRAIETLGALGVAGNQGEVANALAEIAGDEDSPLSVRCAAAKALGQLAYPDPAGMDPESFLTKLSQLAAAVCQTEVAILEKLKRDELISGAKVQGPAMGGDGYDGAGMAGDEGMMGMMEMMNEGGNEMDDQYGGMMGPGGGMTRKDEEEDTMETRRIKGSLRRLKDQLLSVLTGLGKQPRRDETTPSGIDIIVTDADQETQLNDLGKAITALLDVLEEKSKADDEEKLDSDKLDELIEIASNDIRAVVASITGIPADGPDAPADDVPDMPDVPGADAPTAAETTAATPVPDAP